MTLAAGILNRRIAIERKVETPTGTGGTTIAWAPVATVWANIRYLSGSETVRADFEVSAARASIRIRFREDIDATCRAVWLSNGNTTTFEILSVQPNAEERDYMDLAVQTGANDG